MSGFQSSTLKQQEMTRLTLIGAEKANREPFCPLML